MRIALPDTPPQGPEVARRTTAHQRLSIPIRALLPLVIGCLLPAHQLHGATPSFRHEILPILTDHCIPCHGPDERTRKGGLRLDTLAGATAPRNTLPAVAPGHPDRSEALRRIESQDDAERMPPPDSRRPPLAPGQVALLRQWIRDGAPWHRHWSFDLPRKASPPATPGHPVDAFIEHELQKRGFHPAPQAPRHTLLRRLSLDLTGLPPDIAEVERFEQDPAPDAIDRVVDRLLASPHFGERMAMWWLDAARYADTDGFQGDAERTNWPWRDWVIDAFNANLPFDVFTREQFAGDLLPGATQEQVLATTFHRNHMTNGEGGRDPEESRIDYVIDRVNTVGTTWLGLTLACVQCHSHKFDPIPQSDYYALAAFFNSIDEDGRAGPDAGPHLRYLSRHAHAAVIESEQLVARRRAEESLARDAAASPFQNWYQLQRAATLRGTPTWHILHSASLESSEGTRLHQEPDGAIQASGPNPRQDDYRVIAPVPLARVTGLKLEVLPHPGHTHGRYSRGASGEFILTDIKVQVRRSGSTLVRDLAVRSAVADHSAEQKDSRDYGDIKGVLDDDPRNGWTTRGATSAVPHTAIFALQKPYAPGPGETLVLELRQRSTLGDANLGRFRISVTDQAGQAVRSLQPSPRDDLAAAGSPAFEDLDPALRQRWLDQFLEDFEPVRKARATRERAEQQLAGAQRAAEPLKVMVLAERAKPRETFILLRGAWDRHGDKVSPGIIPAVAPWPDGAEPTRLGLARWIASRDNPLTARVFVNHAWQLLFGNGLVRTPDDFGLQGDPPSHPELLDWLAVDFIESGWNIKGLLRLLVTSAAYQRDSTIRPGDLARDPDNRLLARGARFRLPSWMLRDAALKASGLLHPAFGGPPVRPYQPEGVWEELFMGRFQYEPSDGAAQYRRTLYAFWRRAIAPTFLFDSAQRRTCEVRTPRTNTPLQALALLNDITYLEASRALAAWALQQNTPPRQSLAFLFQRVTARLPSPGELAILETARDRALNYYRSRPEVARTFLNPGPVPPAPDLDPADLAAHAIVASTVFNLDESLSHE